MIMQEAVTEAIDPAAGFINGTDLEFSDISAEVERTYFSFPGSSYKLIGKPTHLSVKKAVDLNGIERTVSQRVVTDEGYYYYICPREFWGIFWKVGAGKEGFSL